MRWFPDSPESVEIPTVPPPEPVWMVMFGPMVSTASGRLHNVKARAAKDDGASAADGLRADGGEIRLVGGAGDGDRAVEG